MSPRAIAPVWIAILLALVAASGSAPGAQDRLEPGSPHTTRLEIGELPPTGFSLRSVTDGTIFDLAQQRGERPILLLFFRGIW